MAIPVKLQAFEGPLDLLLHLIEKNKVDIYDIPIVEITRQYLDYVKELPKDDLGYNKRLYWKLSKKHSKRKNKTVGNRYEKIY